MMSDETQDEQPSEEVIDSSETPEPDTSELDDRSEPEVTVEDLAPIERTPRQCQSANAEAKRKRKYGR